MVTEKLENNWLRRSRDYLYFSSHYLNRNVVGLRKLNHFTVYAKSYIYKNNNNNVRTPPMLFPSPNKRKEGGNCLISDTSGPDIGTFSRLLPRVIGEKEGQQLERQRRK